MWKRWCIIVFIVLVVWTGQISQQPIANETANNDEPVQSQDALERRPRDCGCCPCTSGLDTLAESARSAGQVAAGVAECPCCLRDSEPAASALFDIPGQMRTLGTIMRPSEPKEEAKPLLHPEVDLASSFLHTLREATEEEYEDAKARDAARVAAEPGTSVATPETNKNIVTIILNPHPLPDQDDDIIGSGTHTQESRCIHPLGLSLRESSNLVMPKSNLLTDILHIPSLGWQNNGKSSLLHLDNGLSASNVHETVVESPKKLELEKDKSSSNKLLKDNKFKKYNNLRGSLTQPNSRSDNLCIPEMEIKERINRLGKLISATKSQEIQININNDASPSSSNVEEVQIARNIDKKGDMNSLLSQNSAVNSIIQPLVPKNIFKLRDLDLKPLNRNNMDNQEIKINDLKASLIDNLFAHSKANTETLKLPTLSDLIRNSIWVPQKPIKTNEIKTDTSDTSSVDGSAKRTNKIETEILDIVPSSSENVDVVSNFDRSPEDMQSKCVQCESKEISHDNFHIINTHGKSLGNGDLHKDIIENESSVEDKLINTSSENSLNIDSNSAEEQENMIERNVQDSCDKNKFTETTTLKTENINILTDSMKDTSNINKVRGEALDECLNIEKPDKSEDLETKSLESDENQQISSEKTSTETNKDESTSVSTENDNINVDHNNISEKTCFSKENTSKFRGLVENQKSKSNGNHIESSEMVVEASEPINSVLPITTQSLLTSLLKQDTIVQPPSLIIDENDRFDVPSKHFNNTDQIISSFNELRKGLLNVFRNGNTNSKNDNYERSGLKSKNEFEDDMSMATGASAPRPQLFLPLRIDEPLKNLQAIKPLDLSSLKMLNTKLKPLKLKSVFGDNEQLGSEIKLDEEFGDDVSMAKDGSAPTPQLLKPSQEREINFNIFKLNPLTLGEPISNLKAINPLNLNSFKARVRMPNTNFKPLKLESTFGKGDGLLGTSLSLEPLHTPHLPRLNLPDFEEMTSNLRSRAENLLKLDVDAHTLRNSEPIRKLGDLQASIQSNTENAMSNLQQTLASTLDEAKIKTDNLLGNSRYAQPENVLDVVRFDVDDKLQELHSNLADHLSSVHEKLMNPPPLPAPTLSKPIDLSLLGYPVTSNVQKPITLRRNSSKPRKSTTQASRKIKDETLNLRTPTGIDRRLVTSSPFGSRNNERQMKNSDITTKVKNNSPKKPLRYSSKNTAATKTNEPHLRSRERNPGLTNMRVSPVRPVPDIKKAVPFRFLQNPETKRFKAALLTTTTVSPRIIDSSFRANNPNLLAPWTSIVKTTPKPLRINNFPSSDRSPLRLLELPNTKLQSRLFPKDSNGSPSDLVLTKSRPDFNSLKSSFDSDLGRNALIARSKDILKPKFKVNISKLDLPERTGSFRQINNGISRPTTQDTLDFDEVKEIPEPKTDLIDNPLLSRLVESFKSSLPNIDVKPFEKDSISSLLGSTLSSLGSSRSLSSTDMVEGASENLKNAVAIDEPMKENVSYKCRMVCTREK